MYRERVLPPLSWICISLLLIPAVILALAPINITLGVISGIAMYCVAVALLLASSPTLVVSETLFQAGRGRIERRFLGAAEVISDAERFDALHSGLDARAWLCLRGSVDGLVRIHLTDPNDPTPYWMVSTRRPGDLASAINSSADSGR